MGVVGEAAHAATRCTVGEELIRKSHNRDELLYSFSTDKLTVLEVHGSNTSMGAHFKIQMH